MYRECSIPDSFFNFEIEDLTLVSEKEDVFNIPFGFDQSPCEFETTYEVEVTDRSSGKTYSITLKEHEYEDVLEFLEHKSSSTPYLTIDGEKIKTDGVGVYDIKIKATLDNEYQTSASTEFALKIVPPTPFIKREFPPPWINTIKDQFTNTGSEFEYDLPPPKSSGGETMTVVVDLGTAEDFMTYDNTTNKFSIKEGETTTEDEGIHIITITTSYVNATGFEKVYKRQFSLTVGPPDKSKYQSDMINWRNWVKDDVVYTREMEEFHPDQPIPYIASLSNTGVCKIAWDRSMIVRTDVEKIPDT